MIRYASAYLASGVVFLTLDLAWLSFASQRLYRPLIGELLASSIALGPALLFYAVYVGGIVALAVTPALRGGSWLRAARYGAVLGLVAYGTYDLTNQATLRTWATRLTLLDMSWGLVATAIAASAGLLAARAVGGLGPE